MNRKKHSLIPVRVRWIWLFTGILVIVCAVSARGTSRRAFTAEAMTLPSSWLRGAAVDSVSDNDIALSSLCFALAQDAETIALAKTAGAADSEAQSDDADKTRRTVKTSPIPSDLGMFRLTVYTPYCDGGIWGYQTALGVRSRHLVTCAVDPNIIPLGSFIEVGDLTLHAVDTGSAVKGHVIDIFYDGPIEDATAWLSQFGSAREATVIRGGKTAT